MINTQKSQKDKHQIAQYLLKKPQINPFQSKYKGFFLRSDRQKSHQRFQVFKRIKQQYSKQKTALVVKDVQKKLKQWATKKKQTAIKKQKSIQKQNKASIQQQQQINKIQKQKIEEEKIRKKLQIEQRFKNLQQKRQKRKQLINQSRVRSLQIKQPKYKLIQEKFNKIQEQIKLQQERILQQKKASMIVKKQDIKKHQEQYEKIKKQKQQKRKQQQKERHLKIKSAQKQQKQDFKVYAHQDLIKKQQQKEKRKRMKQFNNKIKSMVQLVKRQKSAQKEKSNIQSENITKNISQTNIVKQQNQVLNAEITSKRTKKRQLNATADPRKLGNDYLKQLRNKDSEYLKNKSISLPRLSNIQNSPPQNKTVPYKNYLTQIKIKRKPITDEIEQLKRNCQSKAQVYQILNKKSTNYEDNMVKKIKQLKKINKYDESVMKQSEIDELHARYIKMRLACVNL